MVEATINPMRRPAAFRLGWIGLLFLNPRAVFRRITAETQPVWLTPILILSLTVLFQVGATGWLRAQAAASGEIQLPPDFQYYSPEQQAQILQALEATSSPVFLYVLPGFIALAAVWGGWLVTGSLVHLALTMLGGRGAANVTFNYVAWAGLPFMVRDLVRTGAMLLGQKAIAYPGLSGFIQAGSDGRMLFIGGLLAAVDVYLFWQIYLLVIGSKAAGEISTRKAVVGIFLVVMLILFLRAGLATATGYLGSLTITRPFYF